MLVKKENEQSNDRTLLVVQPDAWQTAHHLTARNFIIKFGFKKTNYLIVITDLTVIVIYFHFFLLYIQFDKNSGFDL